MSTKSEPSEKTEKVTLNVLTKFIKPYNGDRETLPAFLTNCESAISLAAPEQQNILCKYIISQLESKAQTACSLKTFKNWSELKQFLRITFGEKKHSTHLLIELQGCKQLPSETVTQYSLRIEACLTKIQSDIYYSCSNNDELPGRIAAMEELTLNTFILGLNPNFGYIVRCRNPRTLGEAITQATEEEKLFNLTRLSTRISKFCSLCKKQGHSAPECYHRNKERPSPFYKTHHLNNSGPNNPPRFLNKSNIITCAYCKNIGHNINECRKRQYNMQRRQFEPPTQRDSNSQPGVSYNSTYSHGNSPSNNNVMNYCDLEVQPDIPNENLN